MLFALESGRCGQILSINFETVAAKPFTEFQIIKRFGIKENHADATADRGNTEHEGHK